MQRKRFVTVERLTAIATNGVLGGYGRVETFADSGRPRRRVTLRLSMDCQQPYQAELHARDSAWHGRRVNPLTVVIEARCRKCKPCKERRSMFWTGRAISEYKQSVRTFFGTLTFTPEMDHAIDLRCQVRLGRAGTDFWRLSPEELFAERVKEAGREVTLYLKRLREGEAGRTKPLFRYLLIAEKHDSANTSDAKRDRPHWHVLFHETDEDRPLVLPSEFYRDESGVLKTDRYGNPQLDNLAFLKRQWTGGFSSFAMAGSPGAAAYCCKYLTKATAARIRASGRYGQEAELKATERNPGSALSRDGENTPPLTREAESEPTSVVD